MKKLAIYFTLMEEERKLQNLFFFMNVLLLLTTFVSLILSIVFSIPNVIFLFSGITAIFLMLLQSRFILNICENFANRQFKTLYLEFLGPETFYHTERECRNFKKVRRNILIASMRNNYKSIQKGFAYLKDWQMNNENKQKCY